MHLKTSILACVFVIGTWVFYFGANRLLFCAFLVLPWVAVFFVCTFIACGCFCLVRYMGLVQGRYYFLKKLARRIWCVSVKLAPFWWSTI